MALEQIPDEDAILSELALGKYLIEEDDLRNIEGACRTALSAQIREPDNQQKHRVTALSFYDAIWTKYISNEMVNLFREYLKSEEALYGLERDEESKIGYRDHLVHMFNVFVMGLRIITPVVTNSSDEAARRLFKVKDEKVKEDGLDSFSHDYKYQERLLYLWTLVSTFHDLAIPLQHYPSIILGMNKFFREVGWHLREPGMISSAFDSGQLFHYFGLLSSLFDGEVILQEDALHYKKEEKQNSYLVKTFGSLYDENDHGVLSGFFMWKIIGELWLSGKGKYRMGVAQFNKYSEDVLEEDVARAALAISIHNMKTAEEGPSLFPIKFSSFPLTYLLVMTDELQEYVRFGGATPIREVVFRTQPQIRVDLQDEIPNVRIVFVMDDEDEFMSKSRELLEKRGVIIAETIEDTCDQMIDSLTHVIRQKLELGESFKLEIGMSVGQNDLVSKELT